MNNAVIASVGLVGLGWSVVMIIASKKSRRASAPTMGGGEQYVLTPSGPGPHTHSAELEEGPAGLEGTSSEEMGHTHDIVGSIVEPSETPGGEGHTHDLARGDDITQYFD